MSDRGDLIDRANDLAAAIVTANESKIRYQAAHMPAGEPGYCQMCGDYSARLVGKSCAPCRDHYKLK